MREQMFMFECNDNEATQHREIRCDGKLIQEIPRERIDDPGIDEVRPRWGYYAEIPAAILLTVDDWTC